ncbi:MAG: Uma2 family endonuclease [Scytonema sp. CRU_2_7]|nr:Uma2 family endonuclease [Scytonema sp. CRU_2_7]
MTRTTAKWTLDDYHRMIEVGLLSGRQVELLNGEIVEMSPEGPEHAQLSTDAADYLRSLLGEKALVRDAKPITIPEISSEPEPDLAIVQPLRALYRTRHPYPEIFLVIEYSNTSLSKDLDAKRKTYAYAGIKEYWVVDLKNRLVKVLRHPIDENYSDEVTLSEGEISPLAFSEIKVLVQRLLS